LDWERPEFRVRFGATVTAVAGAFRFAAPAILLAWAAHAVVHAMPLVLEVGHLKIPPLPFGPPGWSTGLPLTAASAVVSGLLIRWLLIRTPDALRLDGRLAAYVGLLLLAFVIASLASFAIVPTLRGKSALEVGLLSMAVGGAGLLIDVAYAYLALWPVSLLIGDRLTPGEAVARMRQAVFSYVGLYLLLGVPAAAFLMARTVALRGAAMQLTERFLYAAAGSITATLAFVVLAQIYSRRVRGCDLGQDPPGALADVFE
jgi:hypothetical protein